MCGCCSSIAHSIALPLCSDTSLSSVSLSPAHRLPPLVLRSFLRRLRVRLSAMSAAQEEIITKDAGSRKVQSEGIGPFLNFIESGARDFFSAQVFVTLYDLIFKMCTTHNTCERAANGTLSSMQRRG